MAGPRLEVVPDADWPARLEKDSIHPFYCRIAKPRAYSFQDGTSGLDSGDLIVVNQATWDGAKRAAADIAAKHTPSIGDYSDLMCLVHEASHCMVRLDDSGQPLAGDLDRYSHPDTAWKAIGHAFGKRFPINSFTGFLRWREKPSDAWSEGLAWVREHTSAP